jgi:cobalt-precorrin 5A hydrolase
VDCLPLPPNPYPLAPTPYLWVGIGFQQGVSRLEIERAIEWVFAEYDLDLATIVGIATIDLKAEEIGSSDYYRQKGWFLKTYSPERLNLVAVSHPSSSVATAVGTKSVAEAAALCAAETDILLVPKQKFRSSDRSGWVTIAVSRE